MNGEWLTGTKIWREKISELKITKALNTSVYTTLETWFEDNTYFETKIFVKVLKNSVQDSLHWFGIKWGKLNKDHTTYTVEPGLYDLWGQYFEASRDVLLTSGSSFFNSNARFYDDTGTYAYVSELNDNAKFQDFVVELSTDISGWPSSDVVSSYFWGSAYEDASAVGTYRGMPKDYVTGKQSPFVIGGITMPSLANLKGYSMDDMLEWIKLFNVYVFIDSNDKLRYEHIKFFNDKLTDNAVSFASYLQDYNEVWNYENTSLSTRENVKVSIDGDNNNEDFQPTDIIYSDVRNRTDAEAIEFTSTLDPDINYYGTSAADEEFLLYGAYDNQVHTIFDNNMATFSSEGNSFAITFGPGVVTCGSNNMYWIGTGNADYALTVEVTSVTDEVRFYLVDRSSTSVVSNVVSVTTTGTTTDTLTITGGDDVYLEIRGVTLAAGEMTAWVTLDKVEIPMIPTVDGVLSGDPVSNGAMSVGNIIDSWWQDDRISREGTINGSDYVFNATQYNLQRETVKFHYSAVINPLYGFNDGTRVGRIDKWKRSLATDFYEIDVIYQEDE
jgi:hypothetical protein